MVQVSPARLSRRPSPAALAAIIGILYWTAHTMIRPLVGPEVVSLGGTAGDAGIALASFAVVPTVLAIPIGGATDRIGVRRILVAGAALMVVGGAVLTAPLGIPGVIASQVVAGVGTLMVWVGLQAGITRSDPDETVDRRNARIASFAMALAAGQAIGPLLGGAIADAAGRTASFAVFTGVSALLVVLALGTPRDAPGGPGGRGGETVARGGAGLLRSFPAAATLLRRPVVLVTVVVSFMALVALDLRTAFLPLLLAPTGATALQIGALLTLAAAAGFASRPLFALAMRRLRPALMVGLVLGTSAVSGAAIALVPGEPVAVAVLVVVNGFALGFAQPLTLSLMADFTAPGERGLASGIRSMANRAAQFANPAVLGVASAVVGLAGGFVVVGGLMLVATAACAVVLARGGPDRFESAADEE